MISTMLVVLYGEFRPVDVDSSSNPQYIVPGSWFQFFQDTDSWKPTTHGLARSDHDLILDKKVTVHKQITQEGFPRNPIYRPEGCRVEYATDLQFCVDQSQPLHDLYVHVVKRLLDYHFQCHSQDLQVIVADVTNNSECFWVGNSNITSSSAWPNSINATLHSLLPHLLQDYYWRPTRGFAQEQFCIIHGNITSGQVDVNSSSRLISTKLPWRDFLKEFCLCDSIFANEIVEVELIAQAFGIPTKRYIGNNMYGYNELSWSGKYPQYITPHYSTVVTRSLTRTNNAAVKLAATFPYYMVRATVPSEAIITRQFSSSRTLVIIIGNIRGGEIAWNTLYRNVLEINQADLALCVGNSAQTQNSSLYSRAKYVWEFPEFDDWADAIDLIHDSTWRSKIIGKYKSSWGSFGGVKGHAGSGAIIFMARWFAAQHIQQLNLTDKYDRFVVTRSDHYYACQHDLRQLDDRYMWVPKGEDYSSSGITDRHLVCNAGQILPALDIFPPIVKFPDKYVGYDFNSLSPEQLLKRRWQEDNLWKWVKRFNRPMFTCAAKGDTTRWRAPLNTTVPEGVYLKYLEEYSGAKCNCQGGVFEYNTTTHIRGTCVIQ